MNRLIFACVVLIGGTFQAGATAVRPAAMVPPLSGALPAPEGVDCSIELGLAVCARYCTLDVDGRRLCLNRTEDVRPRVQLEEPRPLRLVPLR
jgi:hypothetical protein